MALTQTEFALAKVLKLFRMSKGKQALVFMQMEEESQQVKLILFLSEHPQATEQEILEAAQRIAAKK